MSPSPERPLAVLFDTDIGSDVDDALALGLLLTVPEALDLVAVTTVSSDVATRARQSAGLLALAGRGDVPVFAGERAPVLRPAERFNWFGHEADCVPEGAPKGAGSEPAPEAIVRLAKQRPGLEIVLVGPLTNLARALALEPDLPRIAGGITVMGGHVREARIGSSVAPYGIDYNLCSDPEATVAVLGAGFRTTLVTADVTLQVWLGAAHLEQLGGAGPFARELAREMRYWEPLQRRIFTGLGGTLEDNVAFLHDPLTVLALFDPSSLVFEDLRIVPTIVDGVLRTIEAPRSSGLGAPMRVATSVDAEAARDAIFSRLLAL